MLCLPDAKLCVCMCVQDRTVRVSSVFDKLTYWNLETPPNSDDTVVMAMDWPELAEAVSPFFFWQLVLKRLVLSKARLTCVTP